MHNPNGGRHELAQNFLADRSVVNRVVELVATRPGLIVEWGTGDGAITLALSELKRPLEGIDIDTRRAQKLSRKVGPHLCISQGDILRHAPPPSLSGCSETPRSPRVHRGGW